ncbi:hypothetical protein FRZ61_29320 [Hypericibacter adhaerens]|uniref:Uncharacterized protein n=1 Tax=Hypericibacter adhaerens TaxID=2602016 RepID=A0A5J6MZ15_9PROT|nr:hypothetical protein FRZ61_29320 [Hypericibacter adhaerens]
MLAIGINLESMGETRLQRLPETVNDGRPFAAVGLEPRHPRFASLVMECRDDLARRFAAAVIDHKDRKACRPQPRDDIADHPVMIVAGNDGA